MKLATFSAHGRTRTGVVIDDQIVALSAAAPHLPTEMVTFLGAGRGGHNRADRHQREFRD